MMSNIACRYWTCCTDVATRRLKGCKKAARLKGKTYTIYAFSAILLEFCESCKIRNALRGSALHFGSLLVSNGQTNCVLEERIYIGKYLGYIFGNLLNLSSFFTGIFYRHKFRCVS